MDLSSPSHSPSKNNESNAIRSLEASRSKDLMRLMHFIPDTHENALDIGARSGHFSRLLSNHFDSVTALDLEKPSIQHEKINCVKGDVTQLEFADDSFDLVFCTEVLEHIPPQHLTAACAELSRVTRQYLVIGVPYKQDIRVGRTTCQACGKQNPPWGHVNSFDKGRLLELFPACMPSEVSFVGKTLDYSNALATQLLDLAGNPYGTYEQEETCIHCDSPLEHPAKRNLLQKICTKMAFYSLSVQKPFKKAHPNWIHILFEKQHLTSAALHAQNFSLQPEQPSPHPNTETLHL